jgi:DNA invertase Pin-like site-specific DNA recombinase
MNTAIYLRTSVDKDNTSINQQKQAGIAFCNANNFQYQCYTDEGRSGYKLEDENETNPFNNRPAFTALMEDIKSKKINSVWVWEHSRLARNALASAKIFHTFKKHKIMLYENGKPYDVSDPQVKFTMQIFDAVSEYEREQIVSRTTRGLHDAINSGARGYSEFYGYAKLGKDDKGHMKWTTVPSEIEHVKFAYKEFLAGKSVKFIVKEIYGEDPDMSSGTLIHKWVRILRQFGNTGYALNTAGLKIYSSFKKCGIDSVKELADPKYYTQSVNYPVQMVSIDDWITVVNKLQGYKKVYKDRMRRTDTEIATGIVSCPYCGSRYYVCKDKTYAYYKHSPNARCLQSPKSFKVSKMNDLFEMLFFYFYLVYDDTKNLIEESQRIIKINIIELKEKISALEIENRNTDKQIKNIQNFYENKILDGKMLELTLTKELELKNKKESNDNALNKIKAELGKLKEKFNSDALELAYYDVRTNVINFFENMSTEEKRAALIKVIKDCQVFGKQILINTGKVLFVLDTEYEYKITDDIWAQFKRDGKFKDNFLGTSKLSEALKDDESFQALRKSNDKMLSNYLSVRRLGNMHIFEFPKSIIKDKFKKRSIDYKFNGIEKVISIAKA